MIKDILQVTIKQKGGLGGVSAIWSWIYANSNAQNIFYGTMKEICEGCQTTYAKINRAFELQKKWNTKELEKTIVLRKDGNDFVPPYNYYESANYFDCFKISLNELTSQYKPIIVIFNTKKTLELNSQAIVRTQIKDTLDTQKVKKRVKAKIEISEEGQLKIDEKAVKQKQEKALLDACLDIYVEFYKTKSGDVSPKIDGIAINALKKIISHFRSINKEQEKKDEAVLNSFNIIFQNWNKYDTFIQNQYSLSQISYNLNNMVTYIRNNGAKMDLSKTEKVLQFEKKMQEFIDSGHMDSVIENLGKSAYSQTQQ